MLGVKAADAANPMGSLIWLGQSRNKWLQSDGIRSLVQLQGTVTHRWWRDEDENHGNLFEHNIFCDHIGIISARYRNMARMPVDCWCNPRARAPVIQCTVPRCGALDRRCDPELERPAYHIQKTPVMVLYSPMRFYNTQHNTLTQITVMVLATQWAELARRRTLDCLEWIDELIYLDFECR